MTPSQYKQWIYDQAQMAWEDREVKNAMIDHYIIDYPLKNSFQCLEDYSFSRLYIDLYLYAQYNKFPSRIDLDHFISVTYKPKDDTVIS